jgi:hypothetical protein
MTQTSEIIGRRSLSWSNRMTFIGDLERFFATALYPNRVLIAVLAIAAIIVIAVVARRRRWDRVARRHPRVAGALVVAALVLGLPLAWYLASPLVLSTTINEPPPAGPGPGTSPSTETPSPAVETSGTSSTARSGTFMGEDEFHFGRGTARLIETEPGRYVVRLEDFEVRNGPDLYVYLSPVPDGYADEAIELGRLKADKGSQNYDVPAGADVGRARSVVIWCKQFAVQFAVATLHPSVG